MFFFISKFSAETALITEKMVEATSSERTVRRMRFNHTRTQHGKANHRREREKTKKKATLKKRE